ncbi:MAG: DUF2461 domain-containing protein [Bacteroidales bacterium]|nr:DUF2461 domain-containing protein [Bacteroidales bacterium]
MKEVIAFLRDLQRNNHREWFNDNKQRYVEAQQKWNGYCEELIREIGKYDPCIASLTLRDCTYRIYRDTRFSTDKSPYKTHFGVFLAPGGKKSMHAGYYFHVGTGEADDYPYAHMLAAGNYCYEPKAVRLLREDISENWEAFNATLQSADPRFAVDWEGALKKVPRGYDASAPYADWMRLKSYCLCAQVDDAFVCAPQLAQRVAELFRTTQPFTAFINRGVDEAREE